MDIPGGPGTARDALLGPNPSPELIRHFSVDKQVDADTPPTLILGATNDENVPAAVPISLYLELHRRGVPASIHLFAGGGHAFFTLPREEWQADIWHWLKTMGVTPSTDY